MFRRALCVLVFAAVVIGVLGSAEDLNDQTTLAEVRAAVDFAGANIQSCDGAKTIDMFRSQTSASSKNLNCRYCRAVLNNEFRPATLTGLAKSAWRIGPLYENEGKTRITFGAQFDDPETRDLQKCIFCMAAHCCVGTDDLSNTFGDLNVQQYTACANGNIAGKLAFKKASAETPTGDSGGGEDESTLPDELMGSTPDVPTETPDTSTPEEDPYVPEFEPPCAKDIFSTEETDPLKRVDAYLTQVAALLTIPDENDPNLKEYKQSLQMAQEYLQDLRGQVEAGSAVYVTLADIPDQPRQEVFEQCFPDFEIINEAKDSQPPVDSPADTVDNTVDIDHHLPIEVKPPMTEPVQDSLRGVVKRGELKWDLLESLHMFAGTKIEVKKPNNDEPDAEFKPVPIKASSGDDCLGQLYKITEDIFILRACGAYEIQFAKDSATLPSGKTGSMKLTWESLQNMKRVADLMRKEGGYCFTVGHTSFFGKKSTSREIVDEISRQKLAFDKTSCGKHIKSYRTDPGNRWNAHKLSVERAETVAKIVLPKHPLSVGLDYQWPVPEAYERHVPRLFDRNRRVDLICSKQPLALGVGYVSRSDQLESIANTVYRKEKVLNGVECVVDRRNPFFIVSDDPFAGY